MTHPSLKILKHDSEWIKRKRWPFSVNFEKRFQSEMHFATSWNCVIRLTLKRENYRSILHLNLVKNISICCWYFFSLKLTQLQMYSAEVTCPWKFQRSQVFETVFNCFIMKLCFYWTAVRSPFDDDTQQWFWWGQKQCDQIGRFIGLWATFKAFGNHLFFQISHILRQFL